MSTAVVTRLIRFLKTDIWRVRSKDLPRSKSLLITSLRVVLLTLRGVTEDRTMLRGSALTFYSLLSVVPVVAMIFGISKGFGFEKNLERILYENFVGQEQVVTKVVEFAHALLENVRGGLVAGIGLLILFYTIVKIVTHIENAFNDIWGVKKGRSLGRKVTDYLSLMLIGPVLLFLSSAMTVTITSSTKLILEKVSLLGAISPLIFFLLEFLPYCALWVLFTFLYMFIPNTRVNYGSGILAGILAGTMYVAFQKFYIIFQIGVAKYNAIYGSFAALPLFFIWLQFSWHIVLFGAEISFAHQNVDTYEFEQDCLNVSASFKRLLALRIVHLLVHHFSEGKAPWTAHQISHTLDIPIRLVQHILYDLEGSGLLTGVLIDNDKDTAYQPARDPEAMTIQYVIDAMEQKGSDNVPVARSEELEKISEALKTFNEQISISQANRRLKEI